MSGLLAALPREQRGLASDGPPTVRLKGNIHLDLNKFRSAPSFSQLTGLTRALAGEFKTGQFWVDSSEAWITLSLAGEDYELRRVGGMGTSHRRLVYVQTERTSTDDGFNEAMGRIVNQFRLHRAPGPRKRGDVLTKSFLFDLRGLDPAIQNSVTERLTPLLDGQSHQGRVIDAQDVYVYVLRRIEAAPDSREWRDGQTNRRPIKIKFPLNPRFTPERYLTFLSGALPMSHVGEVDGELRLGGVIELDDRALDPALRKKLRALVAEVLNGRRMIAGARYDALGADVRWVNWTCSDQFSDK